MSSINMARIRSLMFKQGHYTLLDGVGLSRYGVGFAHELPPGGERLRKLNAVRFHANPPAQKRHAGTSKSRAFDLFILRLEV